ncbi:MAG: hypothetical protein KDJ47_13275 [Hyphomicrobiaceae bacterium]|nr:hypothetical protein [Hyphomicrobiaceae bacterium]
MSETRATPANEADAEYRAIEQTLLETARGRWFLAEHGRRARRLDMTLLEDAIGRLSSALKEPPPVLALMQVELEKLTGYVADTKAQILSKTASSPPTATDSNPDSKQAAPTTVAQMLQMAENIHELTWTLQADELSPQSCEAIARHASTLYAVSRQQAMESERALKCAGALEDTASRLTILLDTLIHEANTYGRDTPVPPPSEEFSSQPISPQHATTHNALPQAEQRESLLNAG